MLARAVLGLIVLGLFLGGCSREPQKSPQRRVAAKVNGEEISLERLQLLHARGDSLPGRSQDPSKLMDVLIDEVLFAQKAAALKLDQRGFVPAALQQATASVLAQAYLEKKVGQPLGMREIAAFYEEHPQLFRSRRVFRVFELAVLAPAERMDAIRKRAARASNLMEVARWLEGEAIAFNVGGVTKTSEHLAPPLLAALLEMKKGELRVLQTEGGVSMLQLVNSEPAPLSVEAAAPMIEALLLSRKRQEIAERERKHLRSVALIELGSDAGGAVAARPPH